MSLENLQTDLCVLQSHLDGLIGCVKKNELTLRRFQELEMQLLKFTNLRDLITHVLCETGDVLEIEHSSFSLIDEYHELSKILEEQGINSNNLEGFNLFESDGSFRRVFGKFMTVYLGRYNADRFGDVFSEKRSKAGKCRDSSAGSQGENSRCDRFG